MTRAVDAPEFARYEALYNDCAGGACVDDPRECAGGSRPALGCADDTDGVLAAYGLTCGVLATTGPCGMDMAAAGWAVAPRSTMLDICPLTCHNARCGAPGSASRPLAP